MTYALWISSKENISSPFLRSGNLFPHKTHWQFQQRKIIVWIIFLIIIIVPLTEINFTALDVFYKILKFYVDGFHSMTVGKTLWLIIGIKLFIMFAILKLFFFPNFLKSNFDNDLERSEYVIEQLTK